MLAFITLKHVGKTTLQKVVFFLIAAIIGLGAFTIVNRNTGPSTPEYWVISPSPVPSQNVNLESTSVEIIVDQCSTYDKDIYVTFDTVWLSHSSPGTQEDNTSPGLNGISGMGVVEPGGSACDFSTETSILIDLPLGDPLLSMDGSPTGGMWPGFWSMHSDLTVYECLVVIENVSPNPNPNGKACEEPGEKIQALTWTSAVFEIEAK